MKLNRDLKRSLPAKRQVIMLTVFLAIPRRPPRQSHFTNT